MNASSFDWNAFSQESLTNSVNSASQNSTSHQHLASNHALMSPQASTTQPSEQISSVFKGLSIEDANGNASGSSVASTADSNAALSLSLPQLSPEESKAYLRWYNDLTIRKHSKLISLDDIFDFFKNFNLSAQLVSYLKTMFARKEDLNIGEFFALTRLISHYLRNSLALPARDLVHKSCEVPKPRSILAKKRVQTVDEPVAATVNNNNTNSPESKIDLDSFAKFIMTGEKPSRSSSSSSSPIKKNKRNKKRVKFSDQLVTVAAASIEEIPQQNQQWSSPDSGSSNLDLSLPMDQLLQKLKTNPTQKHQIAVRNISDKEVQEEQDVLGENFKHFQRVNIESALVHGKAAAIPQELVPTGTGGTLNNTQQYSQFQADINNQNQIQPLKPTLTGSANYLIKKSQENPTNFIQNQNEVPNYFQNQTIYNSSANLKVPLNQGLSTNNLTPNNMSPSNLSPNNLTPNLTPNLSPNSTNSNGAMFNPIGTFQSPNYLRNNGSQIQQNNSGASNSLFQPYQPNIIAGNRLRSGSLSPQPTAPGTSIMDSLTGANNRESNGYQPALPPKINLSSSDLSRYQPQNFQTFPHNFQGFGNYSQQPQMPQQQIPQQQIPQQLQQPQQPQVSYQQMPQYPPQFNQYPNQYPSYSVNQNAVQFPQQQQPPQQQQDDLEWFERD